jgi:hypothetical protein
VAIAVVLIVGGVVAAIASSGSKSSSSRSLGPERIPVPAGAPLAPIDTTRYGQPIDGIQCEAAEQVAYHIHAHLAIFVEGQARQVPYGVGIAPPLQMVGSGGNTFVNGGSCFYWLHTHAADGVIHIESPTQKLYTLGQFFDIWGQPLTTGQVGPAVGQVTVFVNNNPYTGDPRTITLSAHDNVQLDVGTPVVPPSQGDVNFAGTGL